MSFEVIITEIGIITLFGMCIGLILKFQLNTQESRCDKIECFCFKCHRENLSTEQMIELHKFRLAEQGESKHENSNPIVE